MDIGGVFGLSSKNPLIEGLQKGISSNHPACLDNYIVAENDGFVKRQAG